MNKTKKEIAVNKDKKSGKLCIRKGHKCRKLSVFGRYILGSGYSEIHRWFAKRYEIRTRNQINIRRCDLLRQILVCDVIDNTSQSLSSISLHTTSSRVSHITSREHQASS